MSSRFFARGGDSDSESSSDSDESLYDIDEPERSAEDSSEEESDEEEGSDDDSSSDDEGLTGVNRFLKSGAGGAADSDESDEERDTVVRSAKDKRLGELEVMIKKVEDGLKIQDFQTVQKQYDELVRHVPTVIKQFAGKTPKIFVKLLVDLENSVTEAYEKQKVTPKVCFYDIYHGSMLINHRK